MIGLKYKLPNLERIKPISLVLCDLIFRAALPFNAFIFMSLLLPIAAHAFLLNPMIQEINPQINTTTNFELKNESDEDVSFEVKIFSRGKDENGNETRITSLDFNNSQPQFTLKAKESKIIRLDYIGALTIETERAYRVVISQLPLRILKDSDSAEEKMKAQKRSKLLVSFAASLYVRPSEIKKDLIISQKEIVNQIATFEFANKGNVHIEFNHIKKMLSPRWQVTEEDLKKVRRLNILPGEVRKIELKIEDRKPLPVEQWTIDPS